MTTLEDKVLKIRWGTTLGGFGLDDPTDFTSAEPSPAIKDQGYTVEADGTTERPVLNYDNYFRALSYNIYKDVFLDYSDSLDQNIPEVIWNGEKKFEGNVTLQKNYNIKPHYLYRTVEDFESLRRMLADKCWFHNDAKRNIVNISIVTPSTNGGRRVNFNVKGGRRAQDWGLCFKDPDGNNLPAVTAGKIDPATYEWANHIAAVNYNVVYGEVDVLNRFSTCNVFTTTPYEAGFSRIAVTQNGSFPMSINDMWVNADDSRHILDTTKGLYHYVLNSRGVYSTYGNENNGLASSYFRSPWFSPCSGVRGIIGDYTIYQQGTPAENMTYSIVFQNNQWTDRLMTLSGNPFSSKPFSDQVLNNRSGLYYFASHARGVSSPNTYKTIIFPNLKTSFEKDFVAFDPIANNPAAITNNSGLLATDIETAYCERNTRSQAFYSCGIYDPTSQKIFFIPWGFRTSNNLYHCYDHVADEIVSYECPRKGTETDSTDIEGTMYHSAQYSISEKRIYLFSESDWKDQKVTYYDCVEQTWSTLSFENKAGDTAFVGCSSQYSPHENRIYILPTSDDCLSSKWWRYIDCDTGKMMHYLAPLGLYNNPITAQNYMYSVYVPEDGSIHLFPDGENNNRSSLSKVLKIQGSSSPVARTVGGIININR